MRSTRALDHAFAIDPLHERILTTALLRDGQAGARWRALRRDIDLDDLWDGKALDFLPLVYRALIDDGVDDPDLGRLRGVQRRTWYVNQLRFRSLASALEVLGDAGVDALLLKGSAWALTVYPDIGLRPMHDCDVLVRPALVERAVAALVDGGWRAAGRLPTNFARRHQEIDLLDGQDRVVDLHWHLSTWLVAPGQEMTADEPFWDRSVPLEVFGVPTAALDPTDALLHAVLHGAWAGWRFAPQWVADAVYIVGDGTAIEWDRIPEVAARHHLALPVRRALDYLRGRFSVAVPADCLRALDVPGSARAARCFARVGLGAEPTAGEQRWLGPLAQTYRFWTTQTAPLDRWTAMTTFPGWLADHWGVDSPWRLPDATLRRVGRRLRGGGPVGAVSTRRDP